MTAGLWWLCSAQLTLQWTCSCDRRHSQYIKHTEDFQAWSARDLSENEWGDWTFIYFIFSPPTSDEWILAPGKAHSDSRSAYETCLSRRTAVASALHRRRCGGQSLISATRRAVSPLKAHSLLPLSSRNKGFRIALRHRKSRFVFIFFFFFGWRVSRCVVVPTPDKWCFGGALLLPRRFACLQQTGLEMLLCSTDRRSSEVGAHSCPAWMQGRRREGGGGVLSSQRMFLPFDQIRVPSTMSSAGCSALRLRALVCEYFIYPQRDIQMRRGDLIARSENDIHERISPGGFNVATVTWSLPVYRSNASPNSGQSLFLL